MEPMLAIPINLFQEPGWIQLDKATTKIQWRNIMAVWNALLFHAAKLNHAGLVYKTRDQPLAMLTIAKWAKITHSELIQPLLHLLQTNQQISATAAGHYQICHWERFVVVDADNYAGLVKFYDPKQPQPTRTPPPQSATGPASVTPLALQKYTPEQRTKLAATSAKILAYLQQQSGKQFENAVATQQLLADLFDSKVTVKQIKQVIDWKCKDWYGGDFWKFVRPQTLFGPKFKQYLLEAPPPPHVQPAAQLTRAQYLRDLYQLSCGDVAMVLARAADEQVEVTKTEVEAIGHELGY
ncbi:conserved phage C-terminal domain-containing protein [Loigolactobacillus zhaoyuanensis]|uniref:conserved phage C-terminal domain-containing protein n=1 Tax=Loigolactobacillus zhaoyuanensis TaxID=2486017 RepID=UPI000F74BBB9|nr:conserved phage C-terminal domain-containing protein [Loigolactobacillus zhaoyuanensis]